MKNRALLGAIGLFGLSFAVWAADPPPGPLAPFFDCHGNVASLGGNAVDIGDDRQEMRNGYELVHIHEKLLALPATRGGQQGVYVYSEATSCFFPLTKAADGGPQGLKVALPGTSPRFVTIDMSGPATQVSGSFETPLEQLKGKYSEAAPQCSSTDQQALNALKDDLRPGAAKLQSLSQSGRSTRIGMNDMNSLDLSIALGTCSAIPGLVAAAVDNSCAHVCPNIQNTPIELKGSTFSEAKTVFEVNPTGFTIDGTELYYDSEQAAWCANSGGKCQRLRADSEIDITNDRKHTVVGKLRVNNSGKSLTILQVKDRHGAQSTLVDEPTLEVQYQQSDPHAAGANMRTMGYLVKSHPKKDSPDSSGFLLRQGSFCVPQPRTGPPYLPEAHPVILGARAEYVANGCAQGDPAAPLGDASAPASPRRTGPDKLHVQ